MPIKVNNVEITTNKINNNNVSEEKLNGTKIYPSTVYYTVRFYDYSGGSLLKTQQVQQGGNATAPANPTRTGYTFTGWDKSYTNVQSNLNIYGTWQIKTYTVRFYAWDGGSLLKTQTVNHGSSATAPTQPTRPGYTWLGWDKSFSYIISNLDVYGTWQQAGSFETKYTIVDVGDLSYLMNNYTINAIPYDDAERIMGTHAQAILEETFETFTADYVSTNTSFHTDYPLMAPPSPNAIGTHVAICIDDPNYYVSNGYFFILYEVVSV